MAYRFPIYCSAWRRIRMRLKLRTMMALILILGVAIALALREGGRQRRIQYESARAIERAGGVVLYDWQLRKRRAIPRPKPVRLDWLTGIFGDNEEGTVISIELPSDRRSDNVLDQIGHFSALEELDLSQSSDEEAGVLAYASEEGSENPGPLPATVTDAGLAHLMGLKKLLRLDLSRAAISDAGLARLRGLTSLRELSLNRTAVTDAGLAHLQGLTGLQTLQISGTVVQDTGLAHLKVLIGLQVIDLGSTGVTDFGVQELRRSLPNAKILFSSLMFR